MPQIRTLSLDELKDIYETYMEIDFPRGELRPFFSIKKNYEDGNYRGYGFFEGDSFLSYALFYSYPDSDEALMDYFAVVPELRGKGVGSAFLKAMVDKLPEEDTILIEAESVDSSKNESERAERERRISFYERNGAVLTGVRCLLFTVDYEILMISGRNSEEIPQQEESLKMIKGLYQNLYRPIFNKLCKLYISQ